jgi:transcriptional regulator with XRE-family HTH domain
VVFAWRNYRGLTGTELAQQAGLDKSYVWQLEQNRIKQPRGAILRRIADALDVRLEVLTLRELPPRTTAPLSMAPLAETHVLGREAGERPGFPATRPLHLGASESTEPVETRPLRPGGSSTTEPRPVLASAGRSPRHSEPTETPTFLLERRTVKQAVLVRARVAEDLRTRYLLRGEVTSIGRSRDLVDIHLPEPYVSRIHAQVVATEEGYVIMDGSEAKPSTHGTYVDGVRLEHGIPFPLHEGAEIEIVDHYFRFDIEETSSDPRDA